MIKTGLLLSYDYKYLKKSIPLIYNESDEITIAVDKNRITWSGNKFTVPDEFFDWINDFDRDNKIKIYEDNFYNPNQTPTQNGTMERNMLAKFMGKGGWHILLDSDEYFVDFSGFVSFLKNLDKKYLEYPEKYPIQILVFWITLFKKVNKGFLYITDSYVPIEICTNNPNYKYHRVTVHSKRIFSKHYMLHQSWARDEEEIWTKVNNWGAKDDIDINYFFDFWKSVNETNYKSIKNFHLNDPKKWGGLEFVSDSEFMNLKFRVNQTQLIKLKIKAYMMVFIRKLLPKTIVDKIRKIYPLFFSTSLKKRK